MGGMPSAELTVTCLCAEWCGVCREYRPGFFELAKRFPQARFAWLDVEDDAEAAGDLEIENFPTLLVRNGESQLFHGVMPPQHEHLARLLEKLLPR
jgi:thiol-disulfide isomerase/thioredoxin